MLENEENKLEEQEQEETSSADELISNAVSSESVEESTAGEASEETKTEKVEDENKVFRMFKIKDIVFLAIMAACMLITSAFMPLVSQIPIFGIIQVCLGLQFSIFPTIGLMKVRKPGSLLFMSLCCGVILAFMNPVMFFCLLICALITEGLTLLIFRGYKKKGSCLFAGTIYFPLTLPFLYIYYNFMYTVVDDTGEAVRAFINSSAGMAVGMSVAVLAICAVGAILGVIITKELKKAGIIKK